MADAPAGQHESPVVLVIDDDPLVSVVVRRALEGVEHRLFTATNGVDGLQELEAKRPDLVVLDNVLPDGLGMQFLGQIHECAPQVPVLFVTARGSGSTAIEAMRSNAFDYLPKPLEPGKLRRQIHRALSLRSFLQQETEPEGPESPVRNGNLRTPEEGLVPDALVGECQAMQAVFKAVGKVAMQDVPVLLRGEHGTGKEALAREIHRYSTRSQGPIVKVHCPGMGEEQLQQELFGREGATPEARIAGRLQEAAGGTLLLQEIGRLPTAFQAQLLQVLREGTYQPVGGTERLPVPCRIIAITSEELESLVRSEHFRSDLYYTLNSFVINVPALRKRHGDLPLLIAHSMRKLTHIAEGFGIEQPRISEDAMSVLCKYTWPGNIDELESVLKRALVEQKGHLLVGTDIQSALAGDSVLTSQTADVDSKFTTDWATFAKLRIDSGTDSLHAEAIEETERKLFSRVLSYTSGNQAQAARILGITRTSLRKKLRVYGLSAQQLAE